MTNRLNKIMKEIDYNITEDGKDCWQKVFEKDFDWLITQAEKLEEVREYCKELKNDLEPKEAPGVVSTFELQDAFNSRAYHELVTILSIIEDKNERKK